MPRCWALIWLLPTLLGLAACGGTAPPVAKLPEGFHLTVDPASFALGGMGRFTLRSGSEPGGRQLLEVMATDVRELRALLVEVGYDAQRWHPVAAMSSGLLDAGLATDSPALELSDFTQPGLAVHAQVLAHPLLHSGFSGSGALASFEFAPGPAAKQPRQLLASPGFPWSGLAISKAPDSTLSMRYHLDGDYDQNGEVNAADLLQLAQHLSTQVPLAAVDTLAGVVDGDHNGEINAGDILPIARNFRAQVSYRVFRTREVAELPWDFAQFQSTGQPIFAAQSHSLASFAYGNAGHMLGDRLAERLRVEIQLPDDSGYYYFVEAYDQNLALLGTELAAHPGQVMQNYWPHWKLAYDAASEALTHCPSLPGDFNADTEVNVADLVQIAKYYNYYSGDWDWLAKVQYLDFNSDDSINGKDMQGILLLYMQRCDSVRVYMSSSPADIPSDPYAPSSIAPVGTSVAGRLERFAPPSGSSVWVRPVFAGSEGPCSEILHIP